MICYKTLLATCSNYVLEKALQSIETQSSLIALAYKGWAVNGFMIPEGGTESVENFL